MGYLVARVRALKDVQDCGRSVEIVQPSFEDEFSAREKSIVVYEARKKELRAPAVMYFDAVSKTFAAGFGREYVWTYLNRPAWGSAPAGLRLKEFDLWRAENLNGHVGETTGAVAVVMAGPEYKGAVVVRPWNFSTDR